jgi:hypothetical protein
MKERELADRIVRYLHASADRLPPRILHRLRAAREAALARADRGVMPAASRFAFRPARFGPIAALVSVTALALALVLVRYWQQPEEQPVEAADLDSELLTDDLPVTAYLDQGFEIWLYHHGSAQD